MKIRKPRPTGAVLATAALVLSLALVPAAFAGKGGGGGGGAGGCHKGCGGTNTGSFVGTNPLMVTDNGTAGLSYGDQVTFSVTSTATYYFVELDCSQSGTVVERETNGFYVGWPWSKNYTLSSTAWSGGAANCTATLYSSNSDGSNRQNLATESFSVGA
jgi:hypothetical protein